MLEKKFTLHFLKLVNLRWLRGRRPRPAEARMDLWEPMTADGKAKPMFEHSSERRIASMTSVCEALSKSKATTITLVYKTIPSRVPKTPSPFSRTCKFSNQYSTTFLGQVL